MTREEYLDYAITRALLHGGSARNLSTSESGWRYYKPVKMGRFLSHHYPTQGEAALAYCYRFNLIKKGRRYYKRHGKKLPIEVSNLWEQSQCRRKSGRWSWKKFALGLTTSLMRRMRKWRSSSALTFARSR